MAGDAVGKTIDVDVDGSLDRAWISQQLIAWALFFLSWKPARIQLRTPGPWLALGIVALSTLPVLIWNQQNGWITVTHLEARAGLMQTWQPTLRFIQDYLPAVAVLLNPVFFVAAILAAATLRRHHRANPLMIYLWCMGAPLLLGYTLYTVRARVQPNWIAPSVLPLFCFMAIHWDGRWRQGLTAVRNWLVAGLLLGLTAVVLLHETKLIAKLTHHSLDAEHDPLLRARGWRETATVVESERRKLEGDGKPVFIIGAHYGITSLISFYIPEARAAAAARKPIVYYQSSVVPDNQFFFWSGYQDRKGQNALYVQLIKAGNRPDSPPERLGREFASVTDLGVREISFGGRTIRQVRLFACRDFRGRLRSRGDPDLRPGISVVRAGRWLGGGNPRPLGPHAPGWRRFDR
jgi:hypothetical protein